MIFENQGTFTPHFLFETSNQTVARLSLLGPTRIVRQLMDNSIGCPLVWRVDSVNYLIRPLVTRMKLLPVSGSSHYT